MTRVSSSLDLRRAMQGSSFLTRCVTSGETAISHLSGHISSVQTIKSSSSYRDLEITTPASSKVLSFNNASTALLIQFRSSPKSSIARTGSSQALQGLKDTEPLQSIPQCGLVTTTDTSQAVTAVASSTVQKLSPIMMLQRVAPQAKSHHVKELPKSTSLTSLPTASVDVPETIASNDLHDDSTLSDEAKSERRPDSESPTIVADRASFSAVFLLEPTVVVSVEEDQANTLRSASTVLLN